MEKHYDPKEYENKLYQHWEDAGYFKAGQYDSDAYTIVIPPPNITGSLHMGHALNNTIQDILIRYYRMKKRDVLWQPGTDHASIATQMVVERQLAEQGLPARQEMGREAFLERVWQWKNESSGTIQNQLRRLGSSCDWSRERFTMDDDLSYSVRYVFVELYKQGLIYKDNRLVNWDPKMQTAISDLEVISSESQGHLWHINYRLADDESKFITVATTRPETMFGDVAVAVHPDDERYKHLIGKYCILPISERKIPIIADEYADPEQGSGAVKITPAHDFNDFEVGRRHDCEMINIMDKKGHLNENVPRDYRGLERFEARKKLIAQLEREGYLVKIDDITHMVPYGDRGGVPLEPLLTEQWYVKADILAKPAIDAVKQGKTKFFPENWTKTYFDWMENIQPWCISRQLWWGHQIPAWYGDDGYIFVAMDEADAYQQARAHYGKDDVTLTQDNDVLDTWFSSALWPFSTLGWPHKTPEMVAKYYPTDVLTTGFDIIFFWVARMMMMGLHFMKQVPFHTVYIHALVRDEKGQKMSKSKGNVINPLELIDDYGADATRFTLAALAAPGRDIKLAVSKVEHHRNFMTKIWNSARFCDMNDVTKTAMIDPNKVQYATNRWLIAQINQQIIATDYAITNYRFHDYANGLYHFIWGIWCDWYIEMAKIAFQSDDGDLIAETKATAHWGFTQLLIMIHPVMPFFSAHLWDKFLGRDDSIMITDWCVPSHDNIYHDDYIAVEWGKEMISEIRSVRSLLQIPPAQFLPVRAHEKTPITQGYMTSQDNIIKRLARVSDIYFSDETLPKSVRIALSDAVIDLGLGDDFDIAKETQRLNQQIKKLSGDIDKFNQKLNNPKFTANAPDDIIADVKERLENTQSKHDILQQTLDKLS